LVVLTRNNKNSPQPCGALIFHFGTAATPSHTHQPETSVFFFAHALLLLLDKAEKLSDHDKREVRRLVVTQSRLPPGNSDYPRERFMRNRRG